MKQIVVIITSILFTHLFTGCLADNNSPKEQNPCTQSYKKLIPCK